MQQSYHVCIIIINGSSKKHMFILSHLLLLLLHQFSHLLSRQGRNGHADQVLEIPRISLTASRSLNTHPSLIFVSNRGSQLSVGHFSSTQIFSWNTLRLFLKSCPFWGTGVSAKKHIRFITFPRSFRVLAPDFTAFFVASGASPSSPLPSSSSSSSWKIQPQSPRGLHVCFFLVDFEVGNNKLHYEEIIQKKTSISYDEDICGICFKHIRCPKNLSCSTALHVPTFMVWIGMKQHTPLHLRLSQPLQHFHLHQKRSSPPTQQKNDRRMERREPFSSERALKPFFRRSSKGRSQTSASQNLRFNETSTKSNTVHCTCVHHVSSVMTFGDSPEPALQFSSSSARSSKKHSIVAGCQDVPKWLKNVSAGPLSDDNLALNHHLHKACFGTQHLVAAEWTSSLLTHIKYYYYTTLFRLQLSHCCASMSFLIFLFISHSKVSHPISCFLEICTTQLCITYNTFHFAYLWPHIRGSGVPASMLSASTKIAGIEFSACSNGWLWGNGRFIDWKPHICEFPQNI